MVAPRYKILTINELDYEFLKISDAVFVSGSPLIPGLKNLSQYFLRLQQRTSMWADRGHIESTKVGKGRTGFRLFSPSAAFTIRIIGEITAVLGSVEEGREISKAAILHLRAMIEGGADLLEDNCIILASHPINSNNPLNIELFSLDAFEHYLPDHEIPLAGRLFNLGYYLSRAVPDYLEYRNDMIRRGNKRALDMARRTGWTEDDIRELDPANEDGDEI